MKSIIIFLIVIIGSFFFLTGCTLGRESLKNVQKETSMITPFPTTSDPYKLLPKDIPIYPGAKPSNSWSSSFNDGKGTLTSFETEDFTSKITEYYSKELPKNGWIIKTATDTSDGMIYLIEKNERNGWITISAEKNGKTTIGIVINQDK